MRKKPLCLSLVYFIFYGLLKSLVIASPVIANPIAEIKLVFDYDGGGNEKGGTAGVG